MLTSTALAWLSARMKPALKQMLGSAMLTRLAATRLRDSVLILGYHDIGPDTGPGSWLRVRQGEFDRQLTWLARFGRFIVPDELPVTAAEIEGDSRTARSRGLRILLTFDDGYIGNYQLALPILKRHRAPALFFISTWNASTGEPFWFERIAVPIQADARTELDLSDVGLRRYRFHPQDGSLRWDGVQRLLADVKAMGNPGHPAVARVLKRCEEISGERGRAALADCRPLQVAEIRAMQTTGLCHFGSHAHRHEILTCLDGAALAATLQASCAFLETVLLAPPSDLAYPNGDADERVFAAARAAGFRRGYAVEPGVVRPWSAPLQLPRLLIGGYDAQAVLSFKVNRVLLRAALG